MKRIGIDCTAILYVYPNYKARYNVILDCGSHFENYHTGHTIHIQNVEKVNSHFFMFGHSTQTNWTILTDNQQGVALF